jgi:hypothetical protein
VANIPSGLSLIPPHKTKEEKIKPFLQAIVLPGHHDYGVGFFLKIWIMLLVKKFPFLWSPQQVTGPYSELIQSGL